MTNHDFPANHASSASITRVNTGEKDQSDMCGIAGIMGSNRAHAIKKMTDIMVYRGLDSGYLHDDITLDQRRLSIIDLHSGHQPISYEDDTLQLLCRGEIYNSPELRESLIAKGHRFKTATDVP